MIKEWLIRKLGGIPLPKFPDYVVADSGGIIANKPEDIISFLGGISLPKPIKVTQNVTEIPSLSRMPDMTKKIIRNAITAQWLAFLRSPEIRQLSLPEVKAQFHDHLFEELGI